MGVSKQQLLNTVKQLKDYIDYTAGPGEEFYTDFEINTGVDAILGTNDTGNGIVISSNAKLIAFSVEEIEQQSSNDYISNCYKIDELQAINDEKIPEISQITNEREEF